MTQESLQGNEDPQETVKPECFYTSFDEECKVTDKRARTKGQEVEGARAGAAEQGALFVQIPFSVPPLLWRGRSLLTGQSFDLLPGRREDLQTPFHTYHISQIPLA